MLAVAGGIILALFILAVIRVFVEDEGFRDLVGTVLAIIVFIVFILGLLLYMII